MPRPLSCNGGRHLHALGIPCQKDRRRCHRVLRQWPEAHLHVAEGSGTDDGNKIVIFYASFKSKITHLRGWHYKSWLCKCWTKLALDLMLAQCSAVLPIAFFVSSLSTERPGRGTGRKKNTHTHTIIHITYTILFKALAAQIQRKLVSATTSSSHMTTLRRWAMMKIVVRLHQLSLITALFMMCLNQPSLTLQLVVRFWFVQPT